MVWNEENNRFNIQKRCNKIVEKLLKIYDKKVYDHLKSNQVDCFIFLQRYIKCVLNREFSYVNIFRVWDAILANDVTETQSEIFYEMNFNNLNFLDYMCVAMIANVREESILLKSFPS